MDQERLTSHHNDQDSDEFKEELDKKDELEIDFVFDSTNLPYEESSADCSETSSIEEDVENVCNKSDDASDENATEIEGILKGLVYKPSTISRRHSAKERTGLHVSFDDNVRVKEFYSDSITDEEFEKQREIVRNMFQDKTDDIEPASSSAWKMASSVVAATKRLAWLAQSTLYYSAIDHDDEDINIEEMDDSEDSEEHDNASNRFTNKEFKKSHRQTTRQKMRRFSLPDVEVLKRNGYLQEKLDECAISHPNLNETHAGTPSQIKSMSKTGIMRASPRRRYSSVDSLSDLTTERTNAFFRDARNENKPDPFQCFEVKEEPCRLLRVRVLRGRNISKGRLQDMLDTPDPYVVVRIKEAPDGKKATATLDNNVNPHWNEDLTYLLPDECESNIIAEISLMDSNYAVDELYGSVTFDVTTLPLHEPVSKTFKFNETSEVDFEFCMEIKNDRDLRSSLALCENEKKFRSARKKVVQNAMRKLLLEKGQILPRVLREVPTIAVIGSGGGFRAMTGFSGAMKALHDTGLLDCTTYVSGLSGSSWYIATLYAHEDYPHNGVSSVNFEIRNVIQTSPFWLLRPECLMRYSQRLREKMKSGQPVTFTDFFGMLIGQTLLGPKKMNSAKLSDFAEKIEGGKTPMPLLTCLHVRPKTSALTFHDWVEFSPYEIGMAKYGTFMQTKHFGSKFFKGVLAKQYNESPLHFLMGVWGSAFSILFNRLVDKNKGNANGDMKNDDVRQEMEKELNNELNADAKDEGLDDDSDQDFDSDDDDEFEDAKDEVFTPPNKEQKTGVFSSLWNWGVGKDTDSFDSEAPKVKPKPNKSGGILNCIASSVFGSDFLESREYRAGKILNYMRGLSLNNSYPLSPFTTQTSVNRTIAEEGEFQQIHEPIEVQQKRVHLVDAGLTFNSPYPAMLRPQRFVDLIISFDFSARPGEDVEPFKEILLAEKWARLHHLPFPKIDRTVYEKEGMKECYVFKDESNENAPTIIHFVLCNVKFRQYSKPGVRRSSSDVRGNFNIFDAPKTPYSTFNFQYSNEAFDQLHNLMEFNTLLHIDTIVKEIGNCITLRRHSNSRGSVTLKDVRNSLYLSAKNRKSLEKAMLGEGGDGHIYVE